MLCGTDAALLQDAEASTRSVVVRADQSEDGSRPIARDQHRMEENTGCQRHIGLHKTLTVTLYHAHS